MNHCHLPQEELIHSRGNQVKELGRLPTGVTNPKEPLCAGAVRAACVEGTCSF